MARKIYESIGYLKLSLNIKVDGESKYIEFAGGASHPVQMFGRFVTENQKIQEVLEGSENFNKMYKLVFVDNISLIPEEKKESIEEKYEALLKENQRLMSDAEKKVEPEKEDGELTVIKDVFNAQQGRDKLIELFPDEFNTRNLPNAKTIQKRAREKNIVFIDWAE